jgi:hypothetical protein
VANKFNTDLTSKIIELQSAYLMSRMTEKLKDKLTRAEIASIVAETIRRYYVNLGTPLLIKRYAEDGHLPFIEEYNGMMEEIVGDMTILYGEIEKVGESLATHFNYAQSERLRINNTIKAVAGLTNDLNLIANEVTSDSTYIRDSFIDQNGVEYKMIMGTPAQISTREGIVTLARNSTVNRSNSASIKLVQGDGESGTQHLVRRTKVPTTGTEFNTTEVYLYNQMPNDKPAAVLDGRPDTIFEYQTVNVDLNKITETAKGFDFAWAKSKKANDKLRLKLVIELAEVADVNWININPYHPPESTGKVIVYSIRTSEDGFDYRSLYGEGNYIINAELNTTPQTYRQDEIFDGNNDFSASKFSGQGVWSFATRKAKYVELVFDQVESYKELVGHTYYERVTTTLDTSTGKNKESAVRIPESQVPDNVVQGPSGKYAIKDNEYIRKGIDVFEGWRYAIGLRDINIMSYQFVEKSELITKKFTVDKPIKEVMLYANEKIPESFLQDLRKANDWIQYYISFDDINWHRISPMHHSPMSGTVFPPKILEINGANTDLELSFQLYKGYLKMNEQPKSVRLKIVMERPKGIYNSASFTPILEDYSLRLVYQEGNV